MAGEDPGASVITLILDLIRRGWDVVTSTAKTIFQTGLFVYFRKQMMRAQQGPKLKHGKQNLKSLRRHEERGAQIVSVEIGDRDAMKALDHELKALKLDYAITRDESGEYILHYKAANEQSVLLAQQHALEKRYGDPENALSDQWTPNEETLEQETAQQEQSDQREQNSHDEREHEQTDADAQQQEQEQIDDSAREEQERSDNSNREEQEPAGPTVLEQLDRQPSLQSQARRTSPDRDDPHAHLANAPLSDVIAVAKERARTKNLARSQNHGLGHDHHRSRSRDLHLAK